VSREVWSSVALKWGSKSRDDSGMWIGLPHGIELARDGVTWTLSEGWTFHSMAACKREQRDDVFIFIFERESRPRKEQP
jgi:hypothetical protein